MVYEVKTKLANLNSIQRNEHYTSYSHKMGKTKN